MFSHIRIEVPELAEACSKIRAHRDAEKEAHKDHQDPIDSLDAAYFAVLDAHNARQPVELKGYNGAVAKAILRPESLYTPIVSVPICEAEISGTLEAWDAHALNLYDWGGANGQLFIWERDSLSCVERANAGDHIELTAVGVEVVRLLAGQSSCDPALQSDPLTFFGTNSLSQKIETALGLINTDESSEYDAEEGECERYPVSSSDWSMPTRMGNIAIQSLVYHASTEHPDDYRKACQLAKRQATKLAGIKEFEDANSPHVQDLIDNHFRLVADSMDALVLRFQTPDGYSLYHHEGSWVDAFDSDHCDLSFNDHSGLPVDDTGTPLSGTPDYVHFVFVVPATGEAVIKRNANRSGWELTSVFLNPERMTQLNEVFTKTDLPRNPRAIDLQSYKVEIRPFRT